MNPVVRHGRTAEDAPHATIARSHAAWALWLIPAGAVLLCVWFFYRDYVATGPMIKIYFENADGLEEKNTPVRFRGVQAGEVRTIAVSSDHQHAEVSVRMASVGRTLARAGTLFWIVRPELTIGSVSGLGTIVSGEYIAVRPGNGAPTNSFNGVEKEPVADAPQALPFRLVASTVGSVQEQSPVLYRGIRVGEVLKVQLGADARNVLIDARVWKDYAPLVRADSKFWNVGGFDLHVGLFNGLQIKAVSPATIVGGGIEFATPLAFGPPASNGTLFELNEKPEDKWKSWNPTIPLELSGRTPETNDAPGSTSGAPLLGQ